RVPRRSVPAQVLPRLRRRGMPGAAASVRKTEFVRSEVPAGRSGGGVGMDQLPRRKPNLTRTLKRPNRYTTALEGEYSQFAFSEERAPKNKGKWRSGVFHVAPSAPMDLEIGTGNGFHFGARAVNHPGR